jgi:putative aldouronate transport system substrate-binding protein
MKGKPFLIALVALVLCVPFAFGAGQTDGAAADMTVKVNPPSTFPIVNEKITLKGFARLDPQSAAWDTLTLWLDHEELTNIHVEWETPGKENVAERKNLVLASGDLPDFFIKGVLTDSDLIKYGSDGTLIPLEPYMDKWTPGINKLMATYPDVKPAITAPDGHVYGFPRVVDFLPGLVWRSPLMNLTWLDRLGLDVPATSDEFIDALRAFRDQDANGNGDSNDEIPYTSHNWKFAMMAVSNMFGVRFDVQYERAYPMAVDNGKLNMMLDDDEYRNALRYYATLFQEKLMDNEIFAHTAKDYFGKGAAGRVGFTPLYQPRNFAVYANEYDAIVPPKGPDGDQIWNFLQSKVQQVNTFAITNVNQYPEATIRWWDYFYTDEGATKLYHVRPDEFGSTQADGSFRYNKEVLEAEIGFEKFMGKHTIYPGGGAGGWFKEKQMAPGMAGTPMLSYINNTGPYLINVIRPGLRSYEQTERENEIRSDLDVYLKETVAKFAAGEIDIDSDKEWDTWVKTLDRIGMNDLEEILQEAISR